MRFSLLAYRFTFRALDPLSFPPGGAGNALRGAFGHLLRRIACRGDCPGAFRCGNRSSCVYARLFEPSAEGPSGLADAPRPFVIRACALDGRQFAAEDDLDLDVHIFDLRGPAVVAFALALSELAYAGLGAARGRLQLSAIHTLDERRQPAACLFRGGRFLPGEPSRPLRLSLDAPPEPVRRLRVRFQTPTELKAEGKLIAVPEFGVLAARVRDRVSTLGALYGDGPLPVDFRAFGERAARVRLIASDLRWVRTWRRSSRTRQVHPLGGMLGEAVYEGQLEEFLPFLRAAYWTGVGRQTVWGKGVVEADL